MFIVEKLSGDNNPLQLQDPTDKCDGQGKSSPVIETKWTEIFNMIIMIMR
jgi:hypothetical protein